MNVHMPPLSLYIHLPWCVRKCPYCDFNSHAMKKGVNTCAYVAAVLKDLAFEVDLGIERPVDSIFIGGGTPSLFPAIDVARLLDGVRELVAIAGDCEISLEANPGVVETGRFEGYRAAGVNRLSIGVQSLDNAKLTALGRVHTADDACAAVGIARAAGFDRINVDMMFGLPRQSVAEGVDDLAAGLALETTHFSWYQLTLEPNTRFYQHPPPLPEDDDLIELQVAGQALLVNSGFEQYEVSAYAKPAHRCRHNENYWRFGDYIGIGAGAHGKLTLGDGRIVRRWRVRHPDDYMRKAGGLSAVAGQRTLDPDEMGVEFMMNALRLRDGVGEHLFRERTGRDLDTIRSGVDEARQRGLLANDGLYATELGWRFLNDLVAIFEPL